MWNTDTLRIAAGLISVVGMALGQVTTPSKPPLSFEVASIKPAGSLSMSGMPPGMSNDNVRLYLSSTSVIDLVCRAYSVSRNQVVNGPDWLFRSDVERFEIVAKIPHGATKEQVPEMLQALLSERFKLAAHREKRELLVYALTADTGGPKLDEAVLDPPAPAGAGQPAEARSSESRRETLGQNGWIRTEYDGITMERFASILSHYMDRPVVDQTGLKGNYRVFYDIDSMALLRQARLNLASPPRETGTPTDFVSDPRDLSPADARRSALAIDYRPIRIAASRSSRTR
jgi:uncharacterized protein (TIGR03435 family)